jgi:hypothetical protein
MRGEIAKLYLPFESGSDFEDKRTSYNIVVPAS